MHRAAVNTDSSVMITHRLLIRTIEEALHLAFVVVVELDLASAEFVDLTRLGVGSNAGQLLRRQFETLVVVHETWHAVPPSQG